MNDPADLRAIAVEVAGTVGRQVLDRRSAGLRYETKSSTTDLVTEVDEWAEAEVVERLTAFRPGDGLRGEEGAERQSSSGVTWVIDPIDGTTNLLHDLPGYSVSIAAAIDGVAVAGAVYDPVRAELFSAHAGGGATLDGATITASATADLEVALVGTGFSYQRESRVDQVRVLEVLLPLVRDIRRVGGAALDLCSVACGRLDAFYERGLSPWDSAAGALIATEAGAVAVEGPLTWSAGPAIAEEFAAVLDRLGA